MPSLEAIEEQIDDLRYLIDEIEAKQESLCEGCPAALTEYESENYWGARCYREECTCPTDFDVGACGCERGDEYEELEEAKVSILSDIGELQSLDPEIFAPEVA